MKLLNSLKNITPLSGCTVFNLEAALTREEYVTPNLLQIIQSSLKESYVKVSAQNTLALSLLLMNTRGVFIDFSKRMVLVETSDSKEFSIYYYNIIDLERNLWHLFQNTDANDFIYKIKDALYLHRTETDYQKVWSYLVNLSIVYFDKT